MSKDSLVKGTLILAVAALIARVLGLIQRIPLVALIGDSGMATFTIAFNIYTPLLTIATAGIPSALSKMVSERTELGKYAEANRIFRASAEFAVVAGIIMTILLLLVAPSYAKFTGDEEATLAIRMLAPALLLFPLIAIMRGYFQGRQNMMANGLSQIIEQILRLITAIGLAVLFISLGWGHTWAVAGASFGGVMGSVGAFGILAMYWIKMRRKDVRERKTKDVGSYRGSPVLSRKQIYKQLFSLSVPIVLFSLIVPLVYFIDSSTVINLLKDDIGHELAKEQLGILGGRAQSLAGIPIILAIALSQSIIPIISAAYAKKDIRKVEQQASKALRLAILSGLPTVLFITIAARPINGLIFKDEAGTGIIALLTITAIFQIIMQITGSILMGMGVMKPLILQVIVGILVKIVVGMILAPVMGIEGVIVATALCFIVILLMNLAVLRRRNVRLQIMPKHHWVRLFLIVGIVVGIGMGIEAISYLFITWFPMRLNYFFQACVTSGLVIIMYVVMVLGARVVTRQDLERLPGPFRKLLNKAQSRARATGK